MLTDMEVYSLSAPQPLRDRIAHAIEKAALVEQPVPVYLSMGLPATDLLTLAALPDDSLIRYYWEKPDEGFVLTSFGAVVTFDFDSAVSRERTMHHMTLVLERCVDCSPKPFDLGGLRMIGGFSFDLEGAENSTSREGSSPWDGFPRGRYILPEILLIQQHAQLTLTIVRLAKAADSVDDIARALEKQIDNFRKKLSTEPIASESTIFKGKSELPSHDAWVERVRLTQAGMGPEVSKVVLARTLQLSFNGPIALFPVLNRLRTRYPSCTTFLFHFPSLGTFIGATPERLVQLQGVEVYTEALAGTFPRGDTESEDQKQREDLLSNHKERTEHQYVVKAIWDKLVGLTSHLEKTEEPEIFALKNVLHLRTPIKARLKEPIPPLTLAALLHPTPAVGVTAKREAREVIGRYEHQDRGWYAGVLSWIDGKGNGDFVVGLRSALIRETTAFVFAGAGIVSESVPEQEWEETELKMRPLIRALCRSADGTGEEAK